MFPLIDKIKFEDKIIVCNFVPTKGKKKVYKKYQCYRPINISSVLCTFISSEEGWAGVMHFNKF